MSHESKRWIEDECQILIDNSHKSINNIQRLLPNRTSASIRQKCQALGITNELWKCKKAIVGEKLQILKDNIHMAIRDLAELLGVSNCIVVKAIRKHHLKKARVSTIWSQSDVDYLLCNYGRTNIDKICSELDRTHHSILQKASSLNLDAYIQKNKLVENLSSQEMVELYINQNMSIGDIAKKYNVPYSKISTIFKKYNLKIRPVCERGALISVKVGGKSSKHWRGYEEISGSHWCNIKRCAKSRNIQFDITIDYIWNLFIKQERKCFFSGVLLSFGKCCKDKINRTASLDRIDSSKGYIEGNVQWVHKDINCMKMKLSNQEFINFCSLVHNNKAGN